LKLLSSTLVRSLHSPNKINGLIMRTRGIGNSEVCPRCGEFAILDNYTGWCGVCSNTNDYIITESFLARHADAIEHYLSAGYSFSESITKLNTDSRPVCLCCGGFIIRARQNAIFCSKYKKCITSRNRYKYLVHKKGMTPSFALNQVLTEITGQLKAA
jgi:hypothetical protein